jgi:hypothetical protein
MITAVRLMDAKQLGWKYRSAVNMALAVTILLSAEVGDAEPVSKPSAASKPANRVAAPSQSRSDGGIPFDATEAAIALRAGYPVWTKGPGAASPAILFPHQPIVVNPYASVGARRAHTDLGAARILGNAILPYASPFITEQMAWNFQQRDRARFREVRPWPDPEYAETLNIAALFGLAYKNFRPQQNIRTSNKFAITSLFSCRDYYVTTQAGTREDILMSYVDQYDQLLTSAPNEATLYIQAALAPDKKYPTTIGSPELKMSDVSSIEILSISRLQNCWMPAGKVLPDKIYAFDVRRDVDSDNNIITYFPIDSGGKLQPLTWSRIPYSNFIKSSPEGMFYIEIKVRVSEKYGTYPAKFISQDVDRAHPAIKRYYQKNPQMRSLSSFRNNQYVILPIDITSIRYLTERGEIIQ